MQAVNLLPHDARKQTGSFSGLSTLSGVRVVQVGAAVTGAIAVLIGVVYFHERSVVHGKQQTLAEVQARLVAVEARADAIKSAQSAAASRVNVIQSVVGARLNWAAALTDLARDLPANIHLTSLQATSPTASTTVLGQAPPLTTYETAATSTAGGTQTFTVQGLAPSHAVIALTLDRLAALPWLSQVTLQQTSRQDDGTVQFQVAASLSNEDLK
jgi:Tfp pilus assembly protein PilN